jgi:ATP-binding cassette subfamily B protein
MKSNDGKKGLAAEVRIIVHRGRQVWKLVPRRHKLALGGAALIMAVTSAANTGVALLLGSLVDRIRMGLQQQWTREVMYWATGEILGLLALIYIVREGLNVVRRYLVENSCTRLNRDMQVKLVGHLMKTDLGSLTQEKVGALHGKMFRSVDGFIRFLRLMFLDFLPAILTGVFALVAALSKAPLLALVMVGVVPLAVLLTVRQLLSQKGVRLRLMRDCEEIDGAVVEQLGGMEYVRAADTCAQEVRRLARVTEKRRRREIRHHFQMSLFGCAKALNEGLFHVIVLAFATYMAINRQISFGDILTFSVLFLNVMTPLSEIHRVLDEGHEASLRVGDLLEMLGEPLDRSFDTNPGQQPRLVVGAPAITVDNLGLEYTTPDGERKRALDGISLGIRHGETIGVAGRSGSGKSTWIKVLLRLIHPAEGKVFLGDTPLDQVSRADIARLFGYVGQNPFVFAGTVAENIAYGNDQVTPEDIRRAAELAHLDHEILEMPGGYDAEISERGQNLSGGQRQRLAIARILLKNVPILVLDEATSALDNISERHVQRSLGITNTDRTTILVAHRLTTLRDCDRILVFDEGKIVEAGKYDELVQQGGLFTELVMSAESTVSAQDPESPPASETDGRPVCEDASAGLVAFATSADCGHAALSPPQAEPPPEFVR